MNIIYISPLGCFNPNLFPRFKKTFEDNGHTQTSNPNEATHCFMELQSGTIEYDKIAIDILQQKNIPVIFFDNREWGELKNEKWSLVELNPSIYFVRNINISETYPNNVYPFDWPLFPECDFEPTTKDELFSRPYDYCLISSESAMRKNVVDGILKDGRLKLNYKFLDHTERLSYNDWIAEHRKAKLYINCEGGGMTTERPNQLFSVSALLQVRNTHLPANPFTDTVNCVEINQEPTRADIDKVVAIIRNKEWLYDIYMQGIKWIKEKYSSESVANYVLKTISDVGITK